LRITNIACAQVVVVTSFLDVETSNFRITNIVGACVVVVTELSVVPAFWKSGFAFFDFSFHAFEISIARNESFTFTISTNPDVTAFFNVLFVAFSFL